MNVTFSPQSAITISAISAAALGGVSYATQKTILKNPNKIKQNLLDNLKGNQLKSIEKYNTYNKNLIDNFEYTKAYVDSIAKAGKINWKSIAKTAGVAAVLGTVAYGACQVAGAAVNHLFDKK